MNSRELEREIDWYNIHDEQTSKLKAHFDDISHCGAKDE